MPNRYLDEEADARVQEVIDFFQAKEGLEINYSQAIGYLWKYWKGGKK